MLSIMLMTPVLVSTIQEVIGISSLCGRQYGFGCFHSAQYGWDKSHLSVQVSSDLEQFVFFQGLFCCACWCLYFHINSILFVFFSCLPVAEELLSTWFDIIQELLVSWVDQ